MRCAGSTDSHRVRISICPSEGSGIGASFQRNSSPVNLPAGRLFKIHRRFFLSVMGIAPVRPASPTWVLHEAPCHLIPRLVDGTDTFDELRSATASQTGCGDHAIADIRIDTGHQEWADRAEIPALVLDGCAVGFAFAEFSCCERARETDLNDTDVLALVTDLMIDAGRGRRGVCVVGRFRRMQAQLPNRL